LCKAQRLCHFNIGRSGAGLDVRTKDTLAVSRVEEENKKPDNHAAPYRSEKTKLHDTPSRNQPRIFRDASPAEVALQTRKVAFAVRPAGILGKSSHTRGVSEKPPFREMLLTVHLKFLLQTTMHRHLHVGRTCRIYLLLLDYKGKICPLMACHRFDARARPFGP